MDNDSESRAQDGPSSDEASGGSGDAGREHHEPEHPHDTNEGADDRASVVEPDGGPSPRA
jgi:hypothetical protein